MINLTINNVKVQAPVGSTILQACSLIGIEVPRFCYHEKLSIAGNCRMCLVEIGKSVKPVAACALPVANDMVVNTNSLMVKKAREGVLEFLLANHPLDCPICDQGGECDLQDQSMVFGCDRGRFYEYKRAVEDKNCGPIVKTVMTRCIHCTRCVRFSTEVGGVFDLGTTGRGSHTEIGGYIEKVLTSELSGNVIDLCPVGALTSKPYAFTSRSWELKSVETLDVFDLLGSNLRVDIRGTEIMRVLPKSNESLNEEWISDKTRFFYDGLKRQRLVYPSIKFPLSDTKDVSARTFYINLSWDSVLKIFRAVLPLYFNSKIVNVIGNQLDYTNSFALKHFANILGKNEFITSPMTLDDNCNLDFRSNFTLNLANLSHFKNFGALVFVGLNLRLESPVLNSRIRSLVVHQGLKVYSIGSPFNLTYKALNISNNIKVLVDILNGKHVLSQAFKGEKVMFIFGNSFLEIFGFKSYIFFKTLIEKKFKLSNVGVFNSSVVLSDLGVGVKPLVDLSVQKKLVLISNADDYKLKLNKGEDFVIYTGHNGDRGAAIADVILPSPAFTEFVSFYSNVQGLIQRTNKVLTTLPYIRSSANILQAVIASMFKDTNHFMKSHSFFYQPKNHWNSVLLTVVPFLYMKESMISTISIINTFGRISIKNRMISSFISNFYKTDSISRSSTILSLCTTQLLSKNLWKSFLIK